MKRTDQDALTTALILHGAVIVLVLLAGWLAEWFRPRPEPHLFRLAAERMTDDNPAEAAVASTVPPSLPESAAPLPELKVPSLPEPRRTAELPPETPLIPVQPRFEPPPEPRARVQPMSLEEFQRQHGTPRSAQLTPRPPERTAIEPPEIDLSNLRQSMRALAQTPRTASASSTVSGSELEGYFAELRRHLYRYWERPELGSLQLSARVRFSLRPSGRFEEVRIVESSGNPAFDQSVLRAFRRLGAAPPTPDGESYSPVLTFQLIE